MYLTLNIFSTSIIDLDCQPKKTDIMSFYSLLKIINALDNIREYQFK